MRTTVLTAEKNLSAWAVLFPDSPAIVGASCFGMLFALALFPTRCRAVLVLMLAMACLRPFYPRFIVDSDWLPWPWTFSFDGFVDPPKAD